MLVGDGVLVGDGGLLLTSGLTDQGPDDRRRHQIDRGPCWALESNWRDTTCAGVDVFCWMFWVPPGRHATGLQLTFVLLFFASFCSVLRWVGAGLGGIFFDDLNDRPAEELLQFVDGCLKVISSCSPVDHSTQCPLDRPASWPLGLLSFPRHSRRLCPSRGVSPRCLWRQFLSLCLCPCTTSGSRAVRSAILSLTSRRLVPPSADYRICLLGAC